MNCVDQALAVSCLVNVAARDGTKVEFLSRFGYVHQTISVAGARFNNPFFLGVQVWPFPVVNADSTYSLIFALGAYWYERTFLKSHFWVSLASGAIGDACFGPVLTASGLGRATYIDSIRDTSTTPERVILEKDSRGTWNAVPVGTTGQAVHARAFLLGRHGQAK